MEDSPTNHKHNRLLTNYSFPVLELESALTQKQKWTPISFSKIDSPWQNGLFSHQRLLQRWWSIFWKVNSTPVSFLRNLSQGLLHASIVILQTIPRFWKELSIFLHEGTYLFGPCTEVPLCVLETAFCFPLSGLLAFKLLYPQRKPFRSKEATLQRAWSYCNIYDI